MEDYINNRQIGFCKVAAATIAVTNIILPINLFSPQNSETQVP